MYVYVKPSAAQLPHCSWLYHTHTHTCRRYMYPSMQSHNGICIPGRPDTGKRPVRTGIGQIQPAVHGRRACTVCVPLQSICVPFQSILGPLWQQNPVVEAVPIRTEMVRKWTEAVQKRCKHGVRLQQAESVLCPCVQAIFPVWVLYIISQMNITVLAWLYAPLAYTPPPTPLKWSVVQTRSYDRVV